MCWFSMAKYFMFAFNFVLFAAGAATLGLGIYIAESTNDTVEVIGVDISENGSFVLIAAGSVALVMGFLGCCGASKESTGLLGLYFVLLLVIVLLQIAVGIWALVQFDDLDDAVNEGLYALDLSTDEDSDLLIEIQDQLECCGRNNSCVDWIGSSKQTDGEKACSCENGDDHCVIGTGACVGTTGYTYDQNCEVAMTNFVHDNMEIIAGIGIGIGLLEILGLVLSICMCQTLKDSRGYA